MDSSSPVTHIGLCAGYGGIELGLKRAIPNLLSVALCEIEAFAIANLVSKMEAGLMDPAPIWPDLKTFPWEAFRDRVDILTGGYPCQPFSAAGQRKGKDDPRHLWPYIADGIRLLRPRCCFFENVEGHISLGLSDVIEDLAGMGYRTTWGIFSASEVGAPHQRKRVFILANNQRERVKELGRWIATWTQQHSAWNDGSNSWPSRPGEQQYGWEPPRVVADAKESGQRERQEDLGCPQSDRPSEAMGDTSNGTRLGSTQGQARYAAQSDQDMADTIGRWGQQAGSECRSGEVAADSGCQEGSRDSQTVVSDYQGGNAADRQTQPALGRDVDGSAGGMDYAELCVSCDNRTDELRLLGNGVVPATAERAFVSLMRELDSNQAGS